jgi:hypothetical protein
MSELEWGAVAPHEFISEFEEAVRQRQENKYDDTRHEVAAFDPEPVGFSGFMSCATHSLALTDLGLFEVGRYPAMDLSSHCRRYWQWFLHRRLATSEYVAAWKEQHQLSSLEVVDQFFEAMTGRARLRGK